MSDSNDTTAIYRAVRCARASMLDGVAPRQAVTHAANRYRASPIDVAMYAYAAHAGCESARRAMKSNGRGTG